MRRTERERKRLAMASALRNANRLLNLSDNPLVDEPGVRKLAAERYPGTVMADELALSDLVTESARSLLEALRPDRRLAREATVLEAVLSGASVQSAARQLALSREHVSNTTWRTVTDWALDEFERRISAGGRDRSTISTAVVAKRARPMPLDDWKSRKWEGGERGTPAL